MTEPRTILLKVKKIDKLKRQRYEISMKIIELETKSRVGNLKKNEEKEFEILKLKESELTEKIENLK